MTTREAPRRTPKRRRRTPESAEREILDAAEAFLRERPFRDLTVDEVMARTTLSRPSFYVYFRDRHHLAVRLVEGIGAQLFTVADRWLRAAPGGEPEVEIRAAVAGVAAVYAQHGLVLAAIAEASEHDHEVEATYRGLIERFVDATAARLDVEIAGGRADVADAREVARALVWMNERYLKDSLGRLPQTELETVVDTLATVWMRTLYGTAPGS